LEEEKFAKGESSFESLQVEGSRQSEEQYRKNTPKRRAIK